MALHSSNTSNLLTITEANTFLNTNLTTNNLNINNDLIVNFNTNIKGNITLGQSNNTIIFNSKLSNFTMLNNAKFIDNTTDLTIEKQLTNLMVMYYLIILPFKIIY